MDSFEFNKLLGALLATVFVVFSPNIVSEAIFASPAPEKPGYEIVAVEEEEGAGDAEAAGPEPIAPLLASADPAAGEAVFKRCASCHTVEQGGANKTGPNLWEVVNRPVASQEGFNYSAAMTEFAQAGSVAWDYETLNQFLLAPKGLVPGTAMSFAGLKKPEDRAAVIAYLRTLSASPAPLPDPAAAPAAEAAAPAEGEAAAAEGEAAPAEGAAGPATEGAAPAEGEAVTPLPQDAAPAGDAAAPGDAATGGEEPAETIEPAETGAEDAPADAQSTMPPAANEADEPAEEEIAPAQ
jgi:cytochrome c